MLLQANDTGVKELTAENVGGTDSLEYLIDQIGFYNDVYEDYGLVTLIYVGF
jgi:hypothetical protein